MDKRCFKCGENKSVEYFYKHPLTMDGYAGVCKDCSNKDIEECLRKRRERDPEKCESQRMAKILFQRAIRKGILVREPCSVCGESPTDGHHPDYSKPLEIQWLCRKHHRALHRTKKT